MSGWLALVPARGGSKGIPGKNIKPLAGRPLIAWTLRAAAASGVFDRVLVTTDSPEIAAAAAAEGFPPPWLRPAELAADGSPSIDFALHALGRLEAEDGGLPRAVMLLQPTSPFRSAETIRRAARAYDAAGAECLVSVSPAAVHPWKCHFLDASGRLRRAAPGAPEVLRRQGLPPAFVEDGVIYADSPAFLRRERSFRADGALAFRTPPEEALDLDAPEDWARAEELARRGARE